MKPRRVMIVTTSRADWWIWRPVLSAIRDDRKLEAIVASSWFGREDGADVAIDLLTPDGTALRTAEIMADAVREFAFEIKEEMPDVVMVLGDRYEMHSAALACLPLRVPVAHVHGGEATNGAFDEQLRNSITKLSHVHFASHPDYAARLIRMGECPKNVHVVGAPALDVIRNWEVSTPPMDGDYLLATLHPETLSDQRPVDMAYAFLDALDRVGMPVLFTGVNADPGRSVIDRSVREYVAARPKCRAVDTLGDDYYDAMAGARAMVGNSSSGIIEATSFNVPVVNVGDRQGGRIQGDNVWNSDWSSVEIENAIQFVLSNTAVAGVRNATNPYDRGGASERIVRVLRHVELGVRLLRKEFHR